MTCLPRIDTSAHANQQRLVRHFDDKSTELLRKRRHLADQLHRVDQEIAELAWTRQMHIGTVAVSDE
ncbi:MAG: hypothetical protein ABSF66_03495 [Terriglobales bacterium]